MLPTLPLVTIAIPTYNRANNYLPHALLAAVSQTYTNIEIIVSDNCSIDNTEELVKKFQNRKIRYFKHEENIGANNNFNFCLQQAKGDYFLLLHDDDLIDNDFIETCILAAETVDGIGLIRTGTRIIDSEGKILREAPNLVNSGPSVELFLGWFSGKTSLYLCSTLFHTEKLKSIGGLSSKYNLMQDVRVEVQLAAMFNRVEIQDIKASFRRHELELTLSTKLINWCNESLDLLDLMSELDSEYKSFIAREGRQFFARLNYRRAREIKSPVWRIICYCIVCHKFNYRRLPPPMNAVWRLPHRCYRYIVKRLSIAGVGTQARR